MCCQRYNWDFIPKAGVELTEAAIEAWFGENAASPTKSNARAFLLSFLKINVNRAQLSPEQDKVYDRLEIFFSPNNTRNRTRHKRDAGSFPRSYVENLAGLLLDRQRRADHDELEDFFYCSPKNQSHENEDHSYYAMYRYASTGRIVKIFVVCKRPQPKYIPAFSFLTFMRGDPKTFPDLHRETMGVILKWENSYQFLGLSYRIPTYLVDDPLQNVAARLDAKMRPRFLETFAFEYEEIGLEHGLFPGVAFTTAAAGQPVITRVAMLHLGTVASLETNISHSDVQPSVFNTGDLANDLQDMVARLRESKCKGYGRRLKEAVAQVDWTAGGSTQLADEILTMLDNTPSWELSKDNPDPPARLHGHGAIESYSKTPYRRKA